MNYLCIIHKSIFFPSLFFRPHHSSIMIVTQTKLQHFFFYKHVIISTHNTSLYPACLRLPRRLASDCRSQCRDLTLTMKTVATVAVVRDWGQSDITVLGAWLSELVSYLDSEDCRRLLTYKTLLYNSINLICSNKYLDSNINYASQISEVGMMAWQMISF